MVFVLLKNNAKRYKGFAITFCQNCYSISKKRAVAISKRRAISKGFYFKKPKLATLILKNEL